MYFKCFGCVSTVAGLIWWVVSPVLPQGGPGSSLFLWRERCLQAGDLRWGDFLEVSAKEVTEDLGLCPVPFLWKLLGHCAFLQPHHYYRQVCLVFAWLSLLKQQCWGQSFARRVTNKQFTEHSQYLLNSFFFSLCVLFLIVGEPITVPKIEDPSGEMVDIYHTMYIKSLQCLFDKYKTRFGLKESDILHIQ